MEVWGRGYIIVPLLVSTPLLGMVTPSWLKPPHPSILVTAVCQLALQVPACESQMCKQAPPAVLLGKGTICPFVLPQTFVEACFVPGTVLGAGGPGVNKIDKNACLVGDYEQGHHN